MNDEDPTSKSEVRVIRAGDRECWPVITPEGLYRVHLHKEAVDEASTQLDRSRLRTGGRKNNTDGNGFVNRFNVSIKIAGVEMMRLGENFLVMSPCCAAVAPILHQAGHGTLVYRSTTLNNGAAA